MARKRKVDNAVLKRIRQRQAREQRQSRTRVERKRILIVCEGEKTEPNYFRSFQEALPKGVVELEIMGTGDNTLNVVNKAIELWYLLHFEFYQNAIARTRYSELLSNHLQQPYQKNDLNIWDILQEKGDISMAIRRARELSEKYSQNSPAQENPVTYVFKLVEELQIYLPPEK